MRPDAIVVGSGVGGAVTASLLARAGRRVLVLEKNPVVGGILASHRRAGFKIDAGSHLIASGAKGPLGDVLRRLGLERPRFLTHPIPVRARGIFPFTLPARRTGLPLAAFRAARDLGMSSRQAAGGARLVWRILTMSAGEIAQWDRRTLDDLLREHIDHPAAYYLFAFLASIFFVLPPWSVSAGESILALRAVIRDWSLSYVEGGMDSLTGALLSVVTAAGGEILTGAHVAAIEPRGDSLRVAVEDGREWSAPAVACNLAPADLVRLLGATGLPDAWRSRVAAIAPSGNAWQLKIALDRPLVDEGCLIGGISVGGMTLRDLSLDLMHDSVAGIEEGRVTDPLAVYAPVPTNFDASLAPPGKQLLVVSVYGPTRSDPADPPARWREAAIRALATVVPGLEDAILFTEFTSITSLGRWMGKSSNAAICNGQLPGQVGADRLPVATPVRGLFLVGDGAGGRGIGTEMAAMSATEAAGQILREAA